MPETTRAQCPGCAASLADDGHSDVLTCAYCGTRVTVHRRAPAPPRAPAPRERTEHDLLLERLAAEERDWDARIRAAERPGGSDVGLPLFCAAGVMVILFLVGANLDETISETMWAPLAGCAFWLSGPIVAILVYRLRARGRYARAKVVAGHRDEALAPLRARIARLERPQPLTEKQRRVQTLQSQRDEVRRQLDLAYHRVEEARTSGIADAVLIPLIGCGVFVLLIAIAATIVFNRPAEELSVAEVLLYTLGPLAVLVVAIVVPLIWRPLSRRGRVAQLEKERDANAPKLQRRLNEIESELARLS